MPTTGGRTGLAGGKKPISHDHHTAPHCRFVFQLPPKLKKQAGGYTNIITRSRQEMDLLSQTAVQQFLADEQPDYIFIAAAKVGGIHANNTYRADFIYQNLMIEANLIHGAHSAGVQRLMFLGSSCIYPRDCPQPIKEEYLLTGALECTNEPYAIAKIAGIKLCVFDGTGLCGVVAEYWHGARCDNSGIGRNDYGCGGVYGADCV